MKIIYLLVKKNDEFIIDIEDLGTDGEGIGKIQGYTLFVKDALTGDKVRVKIMKTFRNNRAIRMAYRASLSCSKAMRGMPAPALQL